MAVLLYYCYTRVVTSRDYPLSHVPWLTSNTLHTVVMCVIYVISTYYITTNYIFALETIIALHNIINYCTLYLRKTSETNTVYICIYFIEHNSIFSSSEVTDAYISISVTYTTTLTAHQISGQKYKIKISGGCTYTVATIWTFCSLEPSDHHIDFGINKRYIT